MKKVYCIWIKGSYLYNDNDALYDTFYDTDCGFDGWVWSRDNKNILKEKHIKYCCFCGKLIGEEA